MASIQLHHESCDQFITECSLMVVAGGVREVGAWASQCRMYSVPITRGAGHGHGERDRRRAARPEAREAIGAGWLLVNFESDQPLLAPTSTGSAGPELAMRVDIGFWLAHSEEPSGRLCFQVAVWQSPDTQCGDVGMVRAEHVDGA